MALIKGTGRKILSGAALGILGVLLQQTFINLAFDICPHHGPLLFVDHIDQLEELGRVLNLVLAFGEYLPQNTLWRGTVPEAMWCNGLPVRPPVFAVRLSQSYSFGMGSFRL